MSLLANSNAIESGGYNIDRSLRFRSSASANLSRTPSSASSANKWTFSGWIKRGSLGVGQSFFNARDYANAGNGYPFADFYFSSADQLAYHEAYNGAYIGQKITTQVFRDTSAWYHFVFALDTSLATASDRIKLYVNNTRITSFGTSVDPSGYTSMISSAVQHRIGAGSTAPSGAANQLFNGYMAEVNFVSGQQLDPSSFGQTDAVTGVWQPKKYTGTYGTNGFYLDFKDNTSATTLAYDKSGNGNNWTANNISTTAGATYDSMTDVPTLTSATAANFAVLNPISGSVGSATISNGNLYSSVPSTGAYGGAKSTIGIPNASGKWYFEVTATSFVNSGSVWMVLGLTKDANLLTTFQGQTAGSVAYAMKYNTTGAQVCNETTAIRTDSGIQFAQGDVLQCAFDSATGKLWFGKNNSWFDSGSGTTGSPSAGTNQTLTTTITDNLFPFVQGYSTGNATAPSINFGQQPFSYTPPTGFKALNVFNLPDPTIKKPNQYMDATLYTGTGSALSVTNAGSFQPDLVWAKARSVATNNNLYDAVRGTGKILVSNNTDAEVDVGSLGLSAFNSNGFSLGTGSTLNDSGKTYVAWQWKKGATPGFDIVTYTGTGVNRTVAHSLGVAPKMMIIKNRTSAYNWAVYHISIGAGNVLGLNQTAAAGAGATYFNSTNPTSSVFSLGTVGNTNENLSNHVAYLFAEIAGFSKFGSYTGNGSADGSFVYLGFQPSFIMAKMSSSTGNWTILDNKRIGYNVDNNPLYPNLSNAEGTTDLIDITSNGFKIRTTDASVNTNGGTYIFAAFASNPFKTSLAR